MALSPYLQRFPLDEPLGYEWDRDISTSFQENPADDHPTLYEALQLISIKAAYSLGVACSEWVIGRLQTATDVSDAELRIQAAWAASIDYRYADIPKPESPSKDLPAAIGSPLWMTKQFLNYDHQFLIKTYQGVVNKGVRGTALRFALLAQHIAGPLSGYEGWLAGSLRKAIEVSPAEAIPIQQERSVPPDFFDPDFIWSEEAAAASRARLISQLNPSKNSYLRTAEQMRADGFEGEPYPQLH